MDILRKVAGVCVNMGEKYGMPEREGFESKNSKTITFEEGVVVRSVRCHIYELENIAKVNHDVIIEKPDMAYSMMCPNGFLLFFDNNTAKWIPTDALSLTPDTLNMVEELCDYCECQDKSKLRNQNFC